jgi:predicted amidohydrolase
MKIAAIQMVSSTQVPANLQAAGELIAQAAAQGAELIVLPEYFCILGQKDTDKLAVQERWGSGPIQDAIAALARQFGVWIVAGSMPLSTNDPLRVRNSSLVFDPQGVCKARYDKIHLFAFDNGKERYDESRVLEAGNTPVAFDLTARDGTAWRVGLSICYDVRFAALYQALQADILLVPSAFTYTTGQAHWELLLRTRAIENLAYVIAPAQGGTHENGRQTWGHTMVLDAWGQIMNQEPTGPSVVWAQLNKPALLERRQQLPALSHRVTLQPVASTL